MTRRAVDIQQQSDAISQEAKELQQAARTAGGGGEFLQQKAVEAIRTAASLQSQASHADIEDEMTRTPDPTRKDRGL